MEHTVHNRPHIASASVSEASSDAEAFQNKTLRPIIKMLHNLLLLHFSNLLASKRNLYFKLSVKDKSDYIAKIFETDTAYKRELRGIVLGHFTLSELNSYSAVKVEADRRINKIVLERLLSSQDQMVKR